jgi:hypothetical protein
LNVGRAADAVALGRWGFGDLGDVDDERGVALSEEYFHTQNRMICWVCRG